MKISNEQLHRVLKTYNRNQKTKENLESKRKGKGDRLSLSDEVKEVQVAKKALKSQSSTRKEKVAALKKAIKTGNYNVSGEEVAEKMLNRTIVDNLV